MADAHHTLLILPAPPPAPRAPAPERSLSVASDDSAQTLRPTDPRQAATGELKEVTVDDLTREISSLSAVVSSLSDDLSVLLAFRDRVIASGPLSTADELGALAAQTTALGSGVLALAPAVSTTAQRLARLSALARQGLTAALDAELGVLEESLATARLDAARVVDRVRRAAWDEVDARESAKRRLEERVRAENAAIGDDGVAMAVRTAFVGAQRRVAELDVLSYAGRVALENPATELAQLLDEAGDAHKAALSGSSLARGGSRSSAATTLVDPFADPAEHDDGYGKPEGDADGDGEHQPLARMATSSTRHGEEALVGGGGGRALAAEGKKPGRWAMLKLHWREYLSVGIVAAAVLPPPHRQSTLGRSRETATTPEPHQLASAVDVDMVAASPVASTSTATFPPAPPRPYSRDFPPPLAPRHWTVLKEVGDGSFGTVWLADWHSPLNLPPGTQPPGPSSRPEYKGKQLVAIKRMKKAFDGGWDECMKLKELKSLRQIPMHPNIIPLYDAFLLPTTRELYFVFECMEGNLYQLTKSRKGRPLASGLIASIFYQIVAGLHHCHAHGYFHRDLKPENLLITTTGLADYPASSLYALPGAPPEKDVIVIVKLADFGLAREITSKPPYTEYVSTRWYRAPEVLLRSRDYSVPVDMWALGTILVEVVTLKPLFPGDSEVDQVFKICEVLGDPSTDYGVDERGRVRGGGTWARGVKMAKDVGFAFPKVPPRNFASLFDPNTVPVQLIDCITDLLRYEPKARLNTQQCLEHAYFREVAYRFTPRQPHPPPQQLPTPAPSHGSTTSYSSTHPSSSLSLTSASLSSAAVKPVSLASPRSIPPSHSQSQGSAPSFKLPYPRDPNGQALTSPDHYAQPRSQSNFSLHSGMSGMSGASGLSGYQIQVHPGAASPNSLPIDQQSVLSFPSSAAPSGWANGAGAVNGGTLHPSAAALGSLGRRGSLAPSLAPSAAPSTYYDGSIYEGMASSSASSIMSFPIGGDGSPPAGPLFAALSPQQSRASHAARPSSPTSSVYSQPAAAPTPTQQQQAAPVPPPAQAQASASPSLSTRGRWGLFAGSSADKAANAPVQFATTGVNPLKRSPSTASMTSALSGGAPSVASNEIPLDPKKARKEAEKLAKEQEKAARLAKEQQARERARAVMKKKSQLKEAADPLHNFGPQGKAASGSSAAASVASSSASFLDKGKGRALPGDRLVQQRMPQIIEDTSRLQVSARPPVDAYGAGPSGAALRCKARRRDEDDDVHSVSSNETGHSSQQPWPFPVQPGRGRPFSISSKATSASDPERRAQQLLDMDPLDRVSSLSSLPNVRGGVPGTALSSGSMHSFPSYGHYTAPSTGHSSLDANFISNMQGLATSSTTELPWPPPGRQGAEYRAESRPRLASPHAHERYTPYMVPPHGHAHAHPRSPGPTLPPIHSFDTPPPTQHPLFRAGTAATMGGASIASFRSTPAAMPSYFVHPPGGGGDGADAAAVGSGGGSGGGGASGGGGGNTTYHLPYLPAMDADSAAVSPASATFPYPSPSLSGTGAPDQHMPHQYTPG
ncbi:hypothetical protein JCM3770_007261 [Rhodotorula araucariae]